MAEHRSSHDDERCSLNMQLCNRKSSASLLSFPFPFPFLFLFLFLSYSLPFVSSPFFSFHRSCTLSFCFALIYLFVFRTARYTCMESHLGTLASLLLCTLLPLLLVSCLLLVSPLLFSITSPFLLFLTVFCYLYLLLKTGNTGTSLSFNTSNLSTFLTRDGGLTWNQLWNQ